MRKDIGLAIRITKTKTRDGYYMMRADEKSKADYVVQDDLEKTDGLTDAIILKIPKGIQEVHIEALTTDTFNIWYSINE